MRRFHAVERADKVEDRKVLGCDPLDWFNKVVRTFVTKKLMGVIWAFPMVLAYLPHFKG